MLERSKDNGGVTGRLQNCHTGQGGGNPGEDLQSDRCDRLGGQDCRKAGFGVRSGHLVLRQDYLRG